MYNIITKQIISDWNSKWLRGSVGRAHIHIGYFFLKSNEEIVFLKNFFIIYSMLSCLCVILKYIFRTCQSR